MKDNHNFISTVLIAVLYLSSLRLYFSLKATRLFGPFTKIVKLNALALSLYATNSTCRK